MELVEHTNAALRLVESTADEFAGWSCAALLAEIRRCELEETRWGVRRRRARSAANRLPADDYDRDG